MLHPVSRVSVGCSRGHHAQTKARPEQGQFRRNFYGAKIRWLNKFVILGDCSSKKRLLIFRSWSLGSGSVNIENFHEIILSVNCESRK